MCRQLEESRVWAERYRSRPSPKNGLLEPDLSYPLGENGYSVSYNRFVPNNLLPKILPNYDQIFQLYLLLDVGTVMRRVIDTPTV